MADKFKFKKRAKIIEILDIRRLKVRLEDGNEILAIISSRQQEGNSKLEIGQNIIVLCNPYEEHSVKVHKDSWASR
jgi:translation initiation factor IF-1